MKEVTVSAKERIVATATRLFNSVGVHATGIDRIIEESGVAKKTFYNHFPSKNQLIALYFSRKDEIWFARLKKFSSKPEMLPIERVLGLFDGLKEWFSQPDFYGCPFIRGLSDFGEEKNSPELANCIELHFSETQNYIAGLLKEARPKDYQSFVPQIMSLVAGATIVAQASGDSSVADVNKKMARILLTSPSSTSKLLKRKS